MRFLGRKREKSAILMNSTMMLVIAFIHITKLNAALPQITRQHVYIPDLKGKRIITTETQYATSLQSLTRFLNSMSNVHGSRSLIKKLLTRCYIHGLC